MRTLIGFFAASLMISTAAFAAEAEGKIQAIDIEKLTITLDDGKSYKLPGEFDVRIFDIRSGEVSRDRFRSVVDQTGARIVEIPTAGLAPGVYFVRVGTRVARLVVI